MDEFDRLLSAVAALDPQPRRSRWSSLCYCLTDAVWSIGARYDSVVVPLVRRVAHACGDDEPLVPAVDPLPADPVPLAAFLDTFPDSSSLLAKPSWHRTSTRSGLLKAEVAWEHARLLRVHGVDALEDVPQLFSDEKRFDAINAALRALPGEGAHGVRRGYLWMTAGDDQGVKPDRMVLRWLRRQGFDVAPDHAARLIKEIADRLSDTGRPTTPWEVDHAIWKDSRSRRR